MAGILDGIRIVDFTHVWQGPIATQLLADFGADVIKVERPGLGDWSRAWGPFKNGLSLTFAGLNRNKRSVVLDMGNPQGHDAAHRLIATADVLVHNFRPGVPEKLGIDYPTLHTKLPRLVYAFSSGWGDHGPYVDQKRPGHAHMAAATAGLFLHPGSAAPHAPSISVDYPAGMLLSEAILLALFSRERSGKGQMVSTDLFSAALFNHVWEGPRVLNRDIIDQGQKDAGLTEHAIPNAWATSDGYIEVSPVFSDNPLKGLSVALGIGDLTQDPRFCNSQAQIENKETLTAILADAFARRTSAEWMAELQANGVLCAAINSLEVAFQDPQAVCNGMVAELDGADLGKINVVGNPIRASDTPPTNRLFPPFPGEQTRDVLRELGIGESDIDEMIRTGAALDYKRQE